jgi:hypothetical protein
MIGKLAGFVLALEACMRPHPFARSSTNALDTGASAHYLTL